MELILWRHAEAEDGAADLLRELTPKGRKQAEKIGAWLDARLPENTRVLASPAARAQQTAQALRRKIETVDSLRPGAGVKDILKAAGWPGKDKDCVVIAGHQPDLGEMAAYLLGAPGSLSIKKGAVWWFFVRPGAGVSEVALRAVISPDLVWTRRASSARL